MANPTAPARPTDKGAARREQILQAASAVLLEEGYARFSARGVAARAGVGLSHVQYYFPSPADMLAELLDRFVRQYADEMLARFGSDERASPERRLARALEFLLNDEAYRTQCGVFMTEVAGFATRNEAIARALASYYAVYTEALLPIVAALNPALTPRERGARAQQCLALIEGIALARPHLDASAERAFRAKEVARAVARLCGAPEE